MTKTCRCAALALLVLAVPSAACAQATRSVDAPPALDFPRTPDLTVWLQAANAVCAGGPAASKLSTDVFIWNGSCRDGRMDGAGTLTHHNNTRNATLSGSFSLGVAEGHELLRMVDDGRIEGEFHADRLNGPGVVTDAAGIETEGTYRDGVLGGKFATTMPDRSRFEGIYVDGKLDGPSLWRSPGGARIETTYRAGVETGRRVTTYADDSRLALDVANGEPATRGVYTDVSGRRIAGRYRPAAEVPTAHAPPPYPALSRRLNEQGLVLVSFLITDDGYVLDAALRRSSGSQRLDDAALFGVTRWRYQPATVARHRIAEIRTVTIPFAFKYVEPVEYPDPMILVTPLKP